MLTFTRNGTLQEGRADHQGRRLSRFARNTVDLLETVQHLKELGVSVRFEKENIDSLSGDGEVMLTLLASFAQEEITSLSNNVKWDIRKRFEKGIPNFRNKILGLRMGGRPPCGGSGGSGHSRWCSARSSGAARERNTTAESAPSPARSNAASAAAGTVQRSGTSTANTGRSSGGATTSTTATRPAAHRT